MKIYKIFYNILFILLVFFIPKTSFADENLVDLSISPVDVKCDQNVLIGSKVRIYATIHNISSIDASGVVKFYDEKTASYISEDQAVSILPNSVDDVFVDWDAKDYGKHIISVKVDSWEKDINIDNNKVQISVFVDYDTDGDGVNNNIDIDDDNDGVKDSEDSFPLNSKESKDTDNDGIGNNADEDDDNDGVSDIEDVFPLNPKESKDTDFDGVGDNSDVFPYDPAESSDLDSDGLGDNADPNDENIGPSPVIQFDKDSLFVRNLTTFSAIASNDADGTISSYEWDFGDSSPLEPGVVVEHTYLKQGNYIVKLKVTDNDNEYRVAEMQIFVNYKKSFYLKVIIFISVLIITILLAYFMRPKKKKVIKSEKNLRKKKK